jgi:uncharacterized membrane protein
VDIDEPGLGESLPPSPAISASQQSRDAPFQGALRAGRSGIVALALGGAVLGVAIVIAENTAGWGAIGVILIGVVAAAVVAVIAAVGLFVRRKVQPWWAPLAALLFCRAGFDASMLLASLLANSHSSDCLGMVAAKANV